MRYSKQFRSVIQVSIASRLISKEVQRNMCTSGLKKITCAHFLSIEPATRLIITQSCHQLPELPEIRELFYPCPPMAPQTVPGLFGRHMLLVVMRWTRRDRES